MPENVTMIGQETEIITSAANVSNDFLTEVTPDLIFAGERFFTRKRLAEALGLSVQTLAGYLPRRKGPKYIKLGKSCLYGEGAVREWMRSQIIDPKKR